MLKVSATFFLKCFGGGGGGGGSTKNITVYGICKSQEAHFKQKQKGGRGVSSDRIIYASNHPIPQRLVHLSLTDLTDKFNVVLPRTTSPYG